MTLELLVNWCEEDLQLKCFIKVNMYWQDYIHDTGHAIQKGLSQGLHLLEGGLQLAGTLKGAYDLAQSAAPYMRGAMALL